MARSRRQLDWKGPQVRRAIERASEWGIDKTTSECVRDAKENVPVRTGALQGSIRMQPATRRGKYIEGTWGSFDVNYALAIELGNPSLIPRDADNRRESLPYSSRGRNTGNRGFLRGAADKQYPKLAGRIRAAARRRA